MGICCTRQEIKKPIDVPPSVSTPVTSDKQPDNEIYYSTNIINKNFSYNVKYRPRNEGVNSFLK